MTKQETFDRVIKAVIKQGKPAMNIHTCVYRAEDGSKCAAGHLIPDEKYVPATMAMGVVSKISNPAVYNLIVEEGHDPELVRALQRCHDSASRDVNFVKAFADRARGVAFAMDLSTYAFENALEQAGIDPVTGNAITPPPAPPGT